MSTLKTFTIRIQNDTISIFDNMLIRHGENMIIRSIYWHYVNNNFIYFLFISVYNKLISRSVSFRKTRGIIRNIMTGWLILLHPSICHCWSYWSMTDQEWNKRSNQLFKFINKGREFKRDLVCISFSMIVEWFSVFF